MVSTSRCRAGASRISVQRNERRGGEIEALGTILRQDAGQTLLAGGFIQQRQIDAAPARLSLRHDDLHRSAELSCRKPARRLAWRCSSACTAVSSTALVERPLEPEHQLHRVDVRRLRIIKRMEQQPLLQRRQRQDVLDLRIGALQPLDLGLRQRSPTADRTGCGRRRPAPPHGAPAPPGPRTSARARSPTAASRQTAPAPMTSAP